MNSRYTVTVVIAYDVDVEAVNEENAEKKAVKKTLQSVEDGRVVAKYCKAFQEKL